MGYNYDRAAQRGEAEVVTYQGETVRSCGPYSHRSRIYYSRTRLALPLRISAGWWNAVRSVYRTGIRQTLKWVSFLLSVENFVRRVRPSLQQWAAENAFLLVFLSICFV